MKERLACFTLDLEPDFLSEDSHEVLSDDRLFAQFEAFLLRNRIKLTTFVVGKMLDDGIPVAQRFSAIDTEFELHSYSHSHQEPDSEEEICWGKEAYTRYFGHRPRGYRAPNGAISAKGLSVLHREGFLYDASVFPTWRPEFHYNYSRMPRRPFRYEEYPALLELPFAVVPRSRVIVSMSFLKLFGLSFYRIMFWTLGLPDILVFDSHLYDFFLTTPVRNLSYADWRRYPLMRNQRRALQLVQRFIDFLRTMGYTFISMGELYKYSKTLGDDLPSISATDYLPARIYHVHG